MKTRMDYGYSSPVSMLKMPLFSATYSPVWDLSIQMSGRRFRKSPSSSPLNADSDLNAVGQSWPSLLGPRTHVNLSEDDGFKVLIVDHFPGVPLGIVAIELNLIAENHSLIMGTHTAEHIELVW